MEILWLAVYFLHAMGVLLWVGGSLFLNVVLNPKLGVIPPQPAGALSRAIGQRFTVVTWVALGLIAGTGLLMAWRMGVVPYYPFFVSSIAHPVAYKAILWILAAVNGAVITLILQPRAVGRASRGADRETVVAEIRKAGRQIQLLSWANLFVGLLAVVFGLGIKFAI